jgi:hypothetical protein
MNFLRAPSTTGNTAGGDSQADQADQRPAGRVLHSGSRDVLLAAGLAAT